MTDTRPARIGSAIAHVAACRFVATSAIVATLTMVATLAGCRPADDGAERPPNIVVVISDDQSWRDYGFMDSPVAITPSLDRLAESGTVFTHAFSTASACRPSLRSLLTGLEPRRLWALRDALRREGVPFAELAAMRDVDTLPRALATRGYASFQGGKHWEGRFQLTGFDTGTALGFDAERAGSESVLRELSGGEGNELGRTTMAPLLDFVSVHRDDPFFVWFAPMLPHTPHDPPDRYTALYEGTGLSRAEQRYFGNVTRLDERVGELLAHLDALALRDRTLVLFVADNGWDQVGEGGPVDSHLGGPRGKFSVYENGFRTPMIVSWPGVLPEGRRFDTLVSTLDVFPTLLDFAGVSPVPPGRSGVSLRALIEGKGRVDREHLVAGMTRLRAPQTGEVGSGLSAVREEEGFFLRAPGWHYVFMPERDVEELYAIDDDPWQRKDLAARHPDRVARYREAVQAWRRRMRVPAPTRADARREAPGAAGDHSPSSM